MRPFGRQEELGVGAQLSFVSICRLSGLLYDLGKFPGAVPGEGTVHGELFRLRSSHALEVLDHYEGYHPDREEASLFVRRRVALQHPPGQTAWVYWFNGDPTDHPQVPSGHWITYLQNGGSEEP